MSDAIHLQIYRRFFATLFSVIPGVNLLIGSAALILWLFGDVIELDFGISVGAAGITFALGFFAWIFIGLAIQKWAEQKGTGLLVGLCVPFLIVDVVVMSWLFYDAVFAGHEEEAAEAARVVIQTLSMLG